MGSLKLAKSSTHSIIEEEMGYNVQHGIAHREVRMRNTHAPISLSREH